LDALSTRLPVTALRGPRALLLALLCFATPVVADTVRYVYDELGRLVAVVDPAGETTRYTYDEVGNIVSVSRQSSSQVSIVAFTPERGQVGDTVTIYGTGFSAGAGQNAITFNGTPATVASSTATTIVTVVPAAATTGPISVTAPGGSATSTAAFTVFAPQAPQITGFTPLVAPPGGTVTITGSGFEPVPSGNQVIFNTSASAVIAATDISLTDRVPLATGARSGSRRGMEAPSARTTCSSFRRLTPRRTSGRLRALPLKGPGPLSAFLNPRSGLRCLTPVPAPLT